MSMSIFSVLYAIQIKVKFETKQDEISLNDKLKIIEGYVNSHVSCYDNGDVFIIFQCLENDDASYRIMEILKESSEYEIFLWGKETLLSINLDNKEYTNPTISMDSNFLEDDGSHTEPYGG